MNGETREERTRRLRRESARRRRANPDAPPKSTRKWSSRADRARAYRARVREQKKAAAGRDSEAQRRAARAVAERADPLPQIRLPFEPIERHMRARFGIVDDARVASSRGEAGCVTERGGQRNVEFRSTKFMAEAIGVHRARIYDWRKNGIPLAAADELAAALQRHPIEFWPTEFWQIPA